MLKSQITIEGLKTIFLSVTNKLYVCVARRDDHYVRKDGGKFDAEEFENHPERYASTFSHKVNLEMTNPTAASFFLLLVFTNYLSPLLL